MRILMPVDSSEYSKAAVAFVATRTTLFKNPTEVELLNIQYPVPSRAARALGREMVQSYHESEAAKALKTSAAALKRAGANAAGRYVVGTVAHELASIVANDRADLIVMGSHGDTGLKKLILGSVASAVAVSCTKPLLILRGAQIPKRDSLKVGIALDGSPYGLAVARFVARNRDLFGASPSVSLIHVVPDLTKIVVPGWIEREVSTGIKPEQVEAMQNAAFENVFKPAHELLARAGITAAEVRLVGQVPGDAIAMHVTKSRLDLLAMGSLGFGAARHALMGSVATRVASRCRTALLLVREK
ncbi:MAG: universal stress protein [Hydrogenophaga sp.]|uniref:universal stress protein n=1 Tax=Hydrogenophaga sp. TaxID=1904254 RepID=UPI002ABA7ACE|nr:universal stress protein [Hydrogenophaga sp.]MDZ4100137.1 universal stress protein [Hydrogenophaga sp.]